MKFILLLAIGLFSLIFTMHSSKERTAQNLVPNHTQSRHAEKKEHQPVPKRMKESTLITKVKREYFEDGQMKSEKFFQSGEIVEKKIYYPNGNMKKKSNYEYFDNHIIEEREYFTPEGHLHKYKRLKKEMDGLLEVTTSLNSKMFFDSGQMKSERVKDKQGRLIYNTGYYESGQLKNKIYFENGKIKNSENFSINGKLIKRVEYSSSGELMRVIEYMDDSMEKIIYDATQEDIDK